MAMTLKVVIEKARKVLSHDSGPFWQFVKYGVIGVMSTAVQLTVFYVLAATSMKCLGADDVAVKYLGLPSVEVCRVCSREKQAHGARVGREPLASTPDAGVDFKIWGPLLCPFSGLPLVFLQANPDLPARRQPAAQQCDQTASGS